MPIVQIDMIEGRTVDQKRKMAAEITETIAKHANCPKEAVTIIIRDMSKDNIAKAGQLVIDQG